MNRIDRYILGQLLWTTMFVATILTGVVWLSQSLRFIEMIVNRGLSAMLFTYFTMLLMPSFFSVILPIALFASIVFTYNKLISDSEMVVLRAGGLSQLVLARPAIVMAALTSLLCYALTVYFLPASYREFKDMQFELRNSYSMITLQEGVFNTLMNGVTVFVRDRTSAGELNGIIIHDKRVAEKPVTIMAEKGAIVGTKKGPRVIMVNGNRQEMDREKQGVSLLYFDRYSFEINREGKQTGVRWREPRERFLNELFFPNSQEKTLWNYHKFRMEGHHRLAMPLLPFTFALVALAFLLGGDFNRRGQVWRILCSIVAVIVIEASLLGLKSLGERAPWVMPLMYLVSILPALAAVYSFGPWRIESRHMRTAGG